MDKKLKERLLTAADHYHRQTFVADDPICIPHFFTKKQDIEIIGFWIAMLAWGNRLSIIKSGKLLIELMDGSPYDFILHHQETDLIRFEKFVHRTFNATDALYFISFFKHWYQNNESLESAFLFEKCDKAKDVEQHLEVFHHHFFSLENIPHRTKKHVSKPSSKSRCKRLALFLRWMVRSNNNQVDFGLWQQIHPAQLVLPLDVHVERMARLLGLLERKQSDWLAVVELSDNCRILCPDDPCILDYALFGLGLESKNAH